jgi:hypothetical protein
MKRPGRNGHGRLTSQPFIDSAMAAIFASSDDFSSSSFQALEALVLGAKSG